MNETCKNIKPQGDKSWPASCFFKASYCSPWAFSGASPVQPDNLQTQRKK